MSSRSSGPVSRWCADHGWAACHPFAAQGRHDGVRGATGRSRSIRRATTPGGGLDLHDPRPTRFQSERRQSCRGRLAAQRCADVVVAQRVVHVLQLAAGSRDHADVAATAGRDSVPETPTPYFGVRQLAKKPPETSHRPLDRPRSFRDDLRKRKGQGLLDLNRIITKSSDVATCESKTIPDAPRRSPKTRGA